MGSVLTPHEKFRDELYVCFGSRRVRGLSCRLCAAACLFMRVFCCVLVEDQGFEGKKTHRPRRQLPQPCGLQRTPPHPHPTAQGNSCPAPLEKLPHAAVQRTLRHADRSALTWALEESAPAARGHRWGGVCPELMLFLLCTRCRDTLEDN